MKNIRIFRKKAELEAFVRDELIRDRALVDSAFYRALVQFVLDAKAPLFYEQSDPSEYANFSAHYNFVLIRNNYASEALRGLYFLHDFTHMLFYYPHDLSTVTEREFEDALILAEYAASNETEILAHYRVPGLRERVFPDKRLFVDLLRERGVAAKPPVLSLFQLRKALVESDWLDPYFFHDPRDGPEKERLKSYAEGNERWCKKRFHESRRLPNPTEWFFPFLTPGSYERVLASYRSTATQEDYERTVLRNVRLAFALLGVDGAPSSFGECFERIAALEKKVFFA